MYDVIGYYTRDNMNIEQSTWFTVTIQSTKTCPTMLCFHAVKMTFTTVGCHFCIHLFCCCAIS